MRRYISITIRDDGRKSVPNSFAPSAPGKPKTRRKDSPLLTVRSDLAKVRETLLKGDDRKALGLVDYTLDCIDEYIAEGGRV